MVSGAGVKLAEIMDTEAVRLGEGRLDVGDLILLGLSAGAWQRFEREVARGLRVSARATAFRRARRRPLLVHLQPPLGTDGAILRPAGSACQAGA